MIETLLPNVRWDRLWQATVETLFMTSISVVATAVLGILLGLLLFFNC